MSDHFFMRNRWIKAYTYLNLNIIKKSRVNNIVIGNDGVLLPFYSFDKKTYIDELKPDIAKMGEQLKNLDNRIKGYGGEFYFVGVPEQSSFLRDKYPSFHLNNDDYFSNIEKLMFSTLKEKAVKYINMNEIYKNKSRDFYSKIDHHYTFEGAFTLYYETLKMLKRDGVARVQDPLEKDEMDIITLTNKFSGSRNRQLYHLYPVTEKLQIGYPKSKIPYEMVSEGSPDPDFYKLGSSTDMLNYGVYMGWDYAETNIKTNRPELPNLLIFGDSFTNAVEPLFYYNFNETRILDLRHYEECSLYEYIDKFRPDVTLMIRDDLNYISFVGNGDFEKNGKK